LARSRNKTLFELLAFAPWWVSIVAGLLVFIGCKAAPSFLHSTSPALAGVNVLASLLAQHAHFIALFFLIPAGISAFGQFRRRRLLEQQSGIESIRNLSWQEFELLVGEAFRREGFTVEETGGGGADGGIDLRLQRDGKTYVVQCKRWKQRQVPVTAVRELYGLMAAEKAHGAFFVSCGTFTPDAQRFADNNGVVLVDGEVLTEAISKANGGLKREPAPPPTPSAATPSAATPHCPTCGGQMVMRTAKRGTNAGQRFWGCTSFPQCRGTTPAA